MLYTRLKPIWNNVRKGTLLASIFSLGLLSIVGSGGGGGNGDPKPGSLQFSSASYSATEGTDLTVTVTVTRTGGSDGDVSVDYATTDGTATDPDDYTAIPATTLNWADGDAAAKTFDVTIVNDGVSESAESLTVNLSNVVTATLGTPNGATINITDDDNPGTVQLSSATYSVTEGVPTVTITVTRSGGSSGAASVQYATADDTATQPADYTSASGTLNWTDGNADDKTFTVTIEDDADVELIEAFDINLTNASGASMGAVSTASVSITDNDSIQVSGTVRAPGGNLTLNEPSWLQRMFASLLGNKVNAAISDHVTPVAGVDVGVYEITAGGVVLLPAFSTTTTNGSGEYALAAPLNAIDSRYIVRAEGPMGETMDSRIVGNTVDVDPATDATSRMVVAITSNLLDISTQEIIEMHEDIAEFITDIDTTGLDATILSTRLYDEAEDQVGQLNVLRSKVSLGTICGHVQSSFAGNLEDILIIVRDYNDWVTRARTYTDANGDYCLNVPIQGTSNPDGGTFSGEYIIGAINRTTESSASEWLSASGTAYTQHEAMKISVPDATLVANVDFSLEVGARIFGTVKPTGVMAGVEGVQVDIRDFATNRRLATARTETDGSYSVTVIPGSYRIVARNRTTAPYASKYYDGSTGTNNRYLATSVTGIAGSPVNIDFELDAGSELSGTINDGAPVVNTGVKINVVDIAAGSVSSERVTTDRNGYYHIWLNPADDYDLYAYGQRSSAVDLATSTTVDFSGATLSDISGVLHDGVNPVARATVRLYRKDDPGNPLTSTTLIAAGFSDSSGNFTLYTDQSGDHLVRASVGGDYLIGTTAGSIFYDGHTRELSGDVTTVTVGNSYSLPSNVTMPAGGKLAGHVYNEASGSMTLTGMGNFRIQIRDDDNLATAGSGTASTDRFLQARTHGDGSYAAILPAGTYDRVRMRDATGGAVGCGSVTITAGATTVVNFYDGDLTGGCEKP